MNKKERVEIEINKTLELLETTERLSHNPLFFSRLQERLREKTKVNVFSLVFRPILLTCLLALNIITVIAYMSTDESADQTLNEQDPITIFASDFNLDQNNILIIE